MGLILDSSIVIAAERRGDSVPQLLRQVAANVGDQHAVLSSVGLTELAHAVYRAQTAIARERRENFLGQLLLDMEVGSIHQRHCASRRQVRRRTACPWRDDSFGGLDDRSHCT